MSHEFAHSIDQLRSRFREAESYRICESGHGYGAPLLSAEIDATAAYLATRGDVITAAELKRAYDGLTHAVFQRELKFQGMHFSRTIAERQVQFDRALQCIIRLLEEVATLPGDTDKPDEPQATCLGNRKYRVGNRPPLVLEESEDFVLRSLIELGGSGTKSDLERQTGKCDCPRLLKAIRQKHPELAPHILLPGGRGRGGYRTTIRHAGT